ncbi:MAG: SusC/RagA family TonB-linked outer membrane protein [Prevotella sp.]|jgi:TonB-linked SusC/RagA family outer membrane protein|nr:SusC/RagA family TonB-linked outer membrane protein [Prevotella sp.]
MNNKSRKTLLNKMLCLLVTGLVYSSVGYAYDSNAESIAVREQQQEKISIQGKVVDSSGEPLTGVSVVIKGTTQGTFTDINGTYTINAVSGNVLVFSYLGFKTEFRTVENNKTINITLQEDSKMMDEVVVVGYGTTKKANLTGAVTAVDVEKTLGSRPISDVGRGLQGAVAGLTIQIPSGEVGSDPIIKVRGALSSIEGGKSPLILVDNVEVPSIQTINPNDIESISVLKDAASSSIYGSKGAFGVILITTKRGSKTESVSVSYSSVLAWQNVSKKMEMATLDALDYTLSAAERLSSNPTVGIFWKVNRTSFTRAKEWQEKYGNTVKATDPIVYNRDWYMEGGNLMGVRMYDPYETMVKEWAPAMTHNLSLNGSSGKTTYYIGLGFVNQSGMMKPAQKDDFTRYNASLSLSAEVNKYLTLRGGASFSDRKKRYAASAATTSDPWYYLYRWSPMFPVGVEEHGVPVRGPVYETANAITSDKGNRYYSIDLGATFNFTKNWDLKVDFTHYNEETSNNYYLPNFSALDIWASTAAPVAWNDANGNQIYVDGDGNIVSTGGVPAYRFAQVTYNPPGGVGNTQSQIYSTRRAIKKNTLNAYSVYNMKLGAEKEHAFKYTLGTNIVANDWSQITAEKLDLNDFENPQFNFATGTEAVTGNAEWGSVAGFFGRINYAYADKYLLEANLRRDGSSVYTPSLRWRWYPSFSGGWVLSNENFYIKSGINSVLSFVKLRASWGVIGDPNVPNGLYVATLDSKQSTWLTGAGKQFQYYDTPKAITKDISWQDIETLDLGVDWRLWKDKVGLTFDWYQTYTRDMIIAGDALPATFGTAAPKGNFGELRTRGWELSLDFNHRFANGIGINATATLSDAATYITKGTDWKTDWKDRSIGNAYATGARYGDIWGYVTDRLYQKDDFIYKDDGKIQQGIIIINGLSRTTNMLAGNNPNYQTELEGGNFFFGPGDVKFVDLNNDGNIGPGAGTFGDPGDRKVIGNSTPRYEYSFRLGSDYKGFDVSVYLQGIGKRQITGSGSLAVPGFRTDEGAMPQTIAGDFWKEDRTDAFYPRPWNLGGNNTGYNMQVQTRYLLDMSYLRIKNIMFGYSVPAKQLKNIFLTKARVYLSLENFFTFDKLRGLPFDPEEINGYSMWNASNYNSGRTGQGTPTFKTFSVGVQLSF